VNDIPFKIIVLCERKKHFLKMMLNSQVEEVRAIYEADESRIPSLEATLSF
jgi:hypothetical protein